MEMNPPFVINTVILKSIFDDRLRGLVRIVSGKINVIMTLTFYPPPPPLNVTEFRAGSLFCMCSS